MTFRGITSPDEMTEHTRGPERIDDPGATYERFYAEWSWKADAGRVIWVDYRLWLAETWLPDGTPLFRDAESAYDAPEKPILECVPLIEGVRKWDGDTQWSGPENWYFGAEELEALFRAIRRMHVIAADIMGDAWSPEEPK